MIRKIMKNVENNIIQIDDIEYFMNLKNIKELTDLSHKIHRNKKSNINLETNIYYPAIYQIEDNCPTCGYRTSIARQKYTEEFITKNVAHKLSDIAQYDISGINCYNKDISGIKELLIILDFLKMYPLEINVRVSNVEHLKKFVNYNINSIIYPTSLNQPNSFNKQIDENKYKYDQEVLEYIKQELNLKITYEFLIGYGESHHDIYHKILEMRKNDIDMIEIKGFDPFLDSPEEYHPQYSKEYILKIISILRIYFPNKTIKIQYASNGNNYITDYIKCGINTISGIYTPNMNSKLQNIEEISEIIKIK